MKNPDYYNHFEDESYLDYYGYTQRHKRAIDELNGDRPGISPRLRKIVLVTIGVAGLIVLIGKIFG